MTSQSWTAIGLIMDIVGVAILFKWGPPQPRLEGGVNLQLSGPVYEEVENQRAELKGQYLTMSQFGLGLTALGFLFQLIGVYVP